MAEQFGAGAGPGDAGAADQGEQGWAWRIRDHAQVK